MSLRRELVALVGVSILHVAGLRLMLHLGIAGSLLAAGGEMNTVLIAAVVLLLRLSSMATLALVPALLVRPAFLFSKNIENIEYQNYAANERKSR